MSELSLGERLKAQTARSLMGSRLVTIVPRLVPSRAKEIDGLRLHPELQTMLVIRELLGMRPWHQLPVADARAQIEREARMAGGRRLRVGPVRDFTIPGPAGSIAVRHYVSPEPGPRPLVVFFHGGGFVLGSLQSHDQPCRYLAKHACVDVLSVAYRLAPEQPFPAAVEDAYAAFSWARANARALGATENVAVSGDSAGANLAAVVPLLARAKGDPQPAAQLLIYPSMDRIDAWRSLELFEKGYFLSTPDITWCTKHYVGDMDLRDPMMSPLLESDLSGLSPAFVVTAGFDPLRDEGEAYAEALRKAGTPARLYRAPDMLHGFINKTGISPACRERYLDVLAQFKTFLGSALANGT